MVNMVQAFKLNGVFDRKKACESRMTIHFKGIKELLLGWGGGEGRRADIACKGDSPNPADGFSKYDEKFRKIPQSIIIYK